MREIDNEGVTVTSTPDFLEIEVRVRVRIEREYLSGHTPIALRAALDREARGVSSDLRSLWGRVVRQQLTTLS